MNTKILQEVETMATTNTNHSDSSEDDNDENFVILEGESTTDSSDNDSEDVYEVEVNQEDLDDFMKEIKEIKGIKTGESNAVRKFGNFSATQISREINFCESNPQCGNFMIFLSPRIYVKSILKDSRSAKTAIFAIFRAVNCVTFVIFSPLKVQELIKNQNSELPNVLKWQILHFY